MSEELLKCPFCGKTESLRVGTDEEIEEGTEEDIEFYTGYYAVCCSAYESKERKDGGCGAQSGYAPTKKEAIEKWNRRAE